MAEIEGDGVVTSDEFPIRGRDRELREFADAILGVKHGRGRVFLIAGEPGIGKTTLCEVAAGMADEAGFISRWGRSWESGGAPAYWPWVQVLRDIAATGVGAEKAARLPDHQRRALSRLVPDVAGEEDLGLLPEDDQARFSLFDAVSRFLRSVTEEMPLIIILEDLHGADAASVLLLRFLARNIHGIRALILATYRPAEASSRPEVSEAIRETAGDAKVLELHGLGTQDIQRMVKETVDIAPAPQLLRALAERAGGNPFFVIEILRLMRKEGTRFRALDLAYKGLPVPETVGATVLQRLDPLPEGVKEVLRVAAVIGREFDIDLVSSAAQRDAAEIQQALEAARSDQILIRVPIRPQRYSFIHALIREALYGSLDEPERTALHLQVAETLESRSDPDASWRAEIAHHLLAAGDLAEVEKTFRYTRAAARDALRELSYEQAVEFFESALDSAAALDLSSEERGKLLVELGEANLLAGRFQEAQEILWEAVRGARLSGEGRVLALAANSFLHLPVTGTGLDEALIGLFREALGSLGTEEAGLRARIMARWALEYLFADDPLGLAERDRLLTEAVELARKSGSKKDLGEVLRHYVVHASPDTTEECYRAGLEIVAIGEQLADLRLLVSGRNWTLNYLLERGQLAQFFEGLRDLDRMADKMGRPPISEWLLGVIRAMVALFRGDFASAGEESERALNAGGDLPLAMGAYVVQNSMLALEQGRGGDILSVAQVAAQQAPGASGAWKGLEAVAFADAGRVSEARAVLGELSEQLAGLPKNLLWLSIHALVATAAVRLNDKLAAKTVYGALLPYRDRILHTNMSAPILYLGSAEFYLGACKRVLGQWEEAEEHLRAALQIHASHGARPWLARTQVELARTLVASSGDLRLARDLLEESRMTAQELGMAGLEREVDAVADFDSAAAPQPSAAPDHPSLVQEGEYVTFTFEAEVCRLRRGKGIDYLARLLGAPGREVHVLDLVTPGAAGGHRGELEIGAEDAGAVLDREAKAAYRARLNDLREEIEEAEAFNDPERASRAREEMEAILDQLNQAVGLGGRDRKLDSPAERARVNVTKRIRSTIDRLSDGSPRLGRHLKATIKTGTFLSYSEEMEPTRTWEIRLT